MKRTIHFFDRLEDKVRAKLSRYPIVYAFISGVGVVLFWRGVWELADRAGLPAHWSLLTGMSLLLITGIWVANFLGSRIIISGLRSGKKLEEKTLQEIEGEESFLTNLKEKVDNIEVLLREHSKNK